jgi:hypothetical protein
MPRHPQPSLGDVLWGEDPSDWQSSVWLHSVLHIPHQWQANKLDARALKVGNVGKAIIQSTDVFSLLEGGSVGVYRHAWYIEPSSKTMRSQNCEGALASDCGQVLAFDLEAEEEP